MKKELNKSSQKLRVAELFAGVGGFNVGLGRVKNGKAYEVVFANQWEPSTKGQDAFKTYISQFGDKPDHSNIDIAQVPTNEIPDHDLLVGGFPCQDYSVARTLSQAKGINGKKGVLWWSIHRILQEKGKKAPNYLMLENVDRLLKSPASHRGRDFEIILASLADLGYMVEWRAINAADYGMPQRRRRVFIMGYKKGTPPYEEFAKLKDEKRWVLKEGLIAKAFPVVQECKLESSFKLEGDLADISESTDFNSKISKYQNAGMMLGRKVFTTKISPIEESGIKLGDVLIDEAEVPEEFFIKDEDLARWQYLKGGKAEKRKTKDGFEYEYNEGPMVFPDPLDRPSRTIITGEGGSTPSRFKHVVLTSSGRHRRLTPLELERLCMFPDHHTAKAGATDIKRAFFMGNALVVGIITRLGTELHKRANK